LGFKLVEPVAVAWFCENDALSGHCNEFEKNRQYPHTEMLYVFDHTLGLMRLIIALICFMGPTS